MLPDRLPPPNTQALRPCVWLTFQLRLVSLVCLRDQPRVPSAVEAASAQAGAVSLPGGVGEGRRSHRGRSRGIKGEVSRAGRCTPELRRVHGACPRTAAPGLVMEASQLFSMEQKMGLARAGAELSLSGPTCLPLTEDCLRLPPPSPSQNASAPSQPAQTGHMEGQQ